MESTPRIPLLLSPQGSGEPLPACTLRLQDPPPRAPLCVPQLNSRSPGEDARGRPRSARWGRGLGTRVGCAAQLPASRAQGAPLPGWTGSWKGAPCSPLNGRPRASSGASSPWTWSCWSPWKQAPSPPLPPSLPLFLFIFCAACPVSRAFDFLSVPCGSYSVSVLTVGARRPAHHIPVCIWTGACRPH